MAKSVGLIQRYFLFLLFTFGAQLTVTAQKKAQIEIIRADNLIYTERNGVKAQRLIGDVAFKHLDALMYCDSAYLYSTQNVLDAFGSVRINQGDTLNLLGDFLNYKGNEKLATVTGEEVKLISPDFTLYTDRLLYDREFNTATYTTGGRIESKKDSNILRSQIGYYYADEKLFTFRDSVSLRNPDFEMYSDTLKYFTETEFVTFHGPTRIMGDSNLIYCKNGWYDTKKDQSEYYDDAYLVSKNQILDGDTLYYDRKLGYGQADGNVEINDTIEKITIYGQIGKLYELKDSAVVTNQSYLIQELDQDSLFMRADTFKVYKGEDDQQFLSAYYGIKIYKSDMQAICDSIAYSIKDSTIKLYTDPVMWTSENQLTADRIDVRTANSKISSMFLDQNAFVISEVDSIRYDQIKGKVMTAFFKESKLKKIEVRGNGQTTYFGTDEQDKFVGVNVAESSDIDIYLKNKKMNSITFLNMPDAIMHPMGELDPVLELRYSGFKWRVSEKPKNKEAIIYPLRKN